MVYIFFQSLIVGYSGAMMPGPLLTYTIDKSIRKGAKAGPLISLGHALLELILVIIIMLGLGKYLETSYAQIIIGIVGGMVLGFFGISMIKEAYTNKSGIEFTNSTNTREGNMIIEGAVISATNPYFIFWWAAVGLGYISNANKLFGIIGVSLFYLGHIFSDITWYTFISTLVSKSRKFISAKVYRIIIAVLGICLVWFGANFIYGSIKSLIM